MAENKQQRAIAPWEEARQVLSSERGRSELAATLPRHLSADQLIRSFVTAIRADATGKLSACSKASLIEGVTLAAQLGLSLAPALGQMYLVPFSVKGEMRATPIIGYRGLIALAYQSGQVEKIVGRTVHAADQWAYRYGTDEAISHVPAQGDRGAPIASYAIAWLKGSSSPIFIVCTKGDIDKARDASRQKGGPWTTHPAEMAQKTAIRRLCKLLPLSAEDRASQSLAQAVELEDLLESRRPAPAATYSVEQVSGDVGQVDDPWSAAPEPPRDSAPLLGALLDEIEDGGWDPLSWYETVRGGGVEYHLLSDTDVPRLRELWAARKGAEVTP